MTSQLIWTPAVGAAITFGTEALDYFLVGLDGTGAVTPSPITAQAPGQSGVSALDVVLPPRIVSAQAILAGDLPGLWALRQAISAAMSQEPVAAGGVLGLGLLTFKRGSGLADLEIPALPGSLSLPMPASAGIGMQAIDLEWFCPYPFWRATVDTTVTIAAASTPTAVANPGDALVPPLIRIYGDLTLVTVTNLTTGEAFQISGQIPAGQYVEIDTTPGVKQVNLVNGGVRTPWMSHLNIAQDALFQLRPGANSVQWVAGTTGGSGNRNVVLTYRPRTRGV